MRARWLAVAPYVFWVVVALIVLALVAIWGHHLRAYFPNTYLRSSDVMMVLATVIVAVANVSLVLVTRSYTDIAKDSIELAKKQDADRLAIRFLHGLQTNPTKPGRFDQKHAEVWVANLGVRAFLVKKIEYRRHDCPPNPVSEPSQRIGPDPGICEWNEVVPAGAKSVFLLPDAFWKGASHSGVDVEISIWVGDEAQENPKETKGFFCSIVTTEKEKIEQPDRIQAGFEAFWTACCPECGKKKEFRPKGMNSFAEVEEKYRKRIRDDFSRTCPNHASELL